MGAPGFKLPARCQGLFIPTEGTLALELYQKGARVFCLASPGSTAQLSLSSSKPEAPPISPFGSQLRRLLRGSGLIRISRDKGALFFTFQGRDECVLIFGASGSITIFRNSTYLLGDRAQTLGEKLREVELSELPIETQAQDAEETVAIAKRGALTRLLAREIKSGERKLEAIERDAARLREAEIMRREAETLLLHRNALPERPAGLLRLEDMRGELITVELGAEETLTAAIDTRFHRARRLERGHGIATERAATERTRLAELRDLRESIETMNPATIERELELRQRYGSPSFAPRQKQMRRSPFRSFQSRDGLTIHVGRSARENDELTMKIARPHDVFFHLRGAPGSHVIVRTEKKQQVPEQTILDAASLAHHFSAFAKENTAEIQYTERRYIRKPRGSAAGAVRLSKEKTILIQRETERIQRLLATERR